MKISKKQLRIILPIALILGAVGLSIILVKRYIL